MSDTRDWMPGKREEQLLMAKTWLVELLISNGAWTVTAGETAELRDLVEVAEYNQTRLAANAGSRVFAAKTREAFAEMTKFMRVLHRRKFFSPPMEDSDWLRLRLRPPDTKRTPVPVPATFPEIEANTSVIRQLTLRMRDFGATSWARPHHVQSMELAWIISDTRPAEVGDMPHLETASSNPITLRFEDDQRGSRIFYAGRWLNTTSQGGPWSDIESAFIP